MESPKNQKASKILDFKGFSTCGHYWRNIETITWGYWGFGEFRALPEYLTFPIALFRYFVSIPTLSSKINEKRLLNNNSSTN